MSRYPISAFTSCSAGIVLAITIVLAGKLLDWVAPNIMVSTGLGLLALSLALMGTDSAATGYFTLIAWAVVAASAWDSCCRH